MTIAFNPRKFISNSIIPMTLLILFAVSCKDDSVAPVEPDTRYPQYGTPFGEMPNTEDIVMYEVNLRAFGPGGDLQEVIDRLDNIKALGVNVIWLMPIHPVGQINSVNSPYSVQDYKKVGAEYGTLDDLRALTDAAHSRGMAVIMDWVANHTSWDNPWIVNKDWYTQDGAGNIISPAGTNWLDVADLNYTNMDMREAMIDAMHYWVLVANVDGYRCDYADGVPFSFWYQAFNSLDSLNNRDLVYLAEGSRDDHFDAGFDINFGFAFYDALKNVFSGQPVSKLFDADFNEYRKTPDGKQWLRYSTNHDQSAWDATPVTLFGGIDAALAASVVTIFTGGVPMIYSGQEVGMAGTVPFFTNSTINWTANQAMREAYEQILQFYAGSDVARKGTNTTYADNDIFCVRKTLEDEELLIIVNTRNTSRDFAIPAGLQNPEWTNVLSGEAMTLGADLMLEGYQYLILN